MIDELMTHYGKMSQSMFNATFINQGCGYLMKKELFLVSGSNSCK